jgi:PAS domain S-box-containing protein
VGEGLELFIFLAALLVLVAEGMLVFRPAVRSLAQTTAEVQYTRDRLSTILDAAVEYSFIATNDQGIIELFSVGAERMLGYSAAEMIGLQTPIPIHLPSEMDARRQELEAELGRPIGALEVFTAKVGVGQAEAREWTYIRKDGTHLTVLLSVTAWRRGAGNEIGYLGVAVDITRRKQAEAELRRAKQVAETANATKSQFLCNMSHELRTPLNAVIGFANVLLKNKAKNLRPMDVTQVERIASNGKHLLGLINTILDLSKVEAGRITAELAPCNVRALITETLAQLQSQVVDRPVELRAELPDHLALLNTDAGKLRQVLINLVGNALKFTAQGSVIVRAQTDAQGALHLLDVIDTGLGIPTAKQAQIWEAFQQVDNSDTRQHGGTGLGLTLARSFCTLLGYDLRLLHSEPGVGSTFRITLPVVSPPPPEMLTSTAPVVIGRPNVLVIDDEADARVVQSHLLDDLGCTVLTAPDGPTGLEMARTHQPHLILLDLMMPGMNGWEVLRTLKSDEKLRGIPVVIASVVARDHKATLPEAVDHLDKPLTRTEMARLLRRNLPGAGSKILLVDPTETEDAAADNGALDVRRVASPANVGPVLEQFTPNVLVLFAEHTTPAQAEQLLTALKQHPAHQQVPVVLVMTEPLQTDRAARWPRELALLTLPPQQNLRAWLRQWLPG